MLIQSSANVAPPSQAAKPAKEGVTVAIAAQPPNAEPRPAIPPGTPQPPAKQAIEAMSVQVSAEQLKKVAENINKVLRESGRSLEFSVDKDTNKQVFRLLDTETGDVIRQFPTEEMLAISRAIDKFQQDVLPNNKQDLRLTDQIQQGLLLRQEA
ncbi:MAG: flagellar protein FlaG [Gallionellaceae bacterium]|nr:flagellar protein FlaG [Gallionellaceae bacterium]